MNINGHVEFHFEEGPVKIVKVGGSTLGIINKKRQRPTSVVMDCHMTGELDPVAAAKFADWVRGITGAFGPFPASSRGPIHHPLEKFLQMRFALKSNTIPGMVRHEIDCMKLNQILIQYGWLDFRKAADQLDVGDELKISEEYTLIREK